MSFTSALLEKQAGTSSCICAGIDTDYSKMPKGRTGELLGRGSFKNRLLMFGMAYVNALADYACVFKPNLAFWAAYGAEDVLAELIRYAHSLGGLLVILDAKYGDIGNTATFLAQTAFERYGADAVTVNAYLGSDTLEPWLEYGDDKAIFVLCHTSNPGAGEFQEQKLSSNERQLFVHLAECVTAKAKSDHTQIGLVMGATFPKQIAFLHGIVPDTTGLLIPGIGKQTGALGETIVHARRYPFMINISRELMYASPNADFAQAAVRRAIEYRDQINAALAA